MPSTNTTFADLVPVTLAEVDLVLRPENGWTEIPSMSHTHAYRCYLLPEAPHVEIRVRAPIHHVPTLFGVSAFDRLRNVTVHPESSVLRVKGWEGHLREAVRLVLNDVRSRLKKVDSTPAAVTTAHPVAAPLFALFAKAKANGLQWPKLRFTVDGKKLVVSMAGAKARYPGSLDLTDGAPFGQGKWFGRISVDGKLSPSKSWEPWINSLLVDFSSDPAGFGAMHGKQTGNCCFCGRHLETKESVSAGYGPVCASKWSLPWGDVTEGKS